MGAFGRIPNISRTKLWPHKVLGFVDSGKNKLCNLSIYMSLRRFRLKNYTSVLGF